MKTLILFLLIGTIQTAFANLHLAPKSFGISEGKRAIWTDFKKATYIINYDHKKKTTWVETEIVFVNKEKGYPIFDLVHEPTAIILDGKVTSQQEIAVPGNITKVRIANTEVSPGEHILRITHRLRNGTKYTPKGVQSAFWIRDLKDRDFLEKYLPSNYEYDQYQMTMFVNIINSKRIHNIFANGEVEELATNSFKITFPAYYTSTSVFYHLMPLTRFKRTYWTYTSIDGREIPVVIYSNFWWLNNMMVKKTKEVLAELENDYGPYPHPKLIIYGTRIKGGMEYVGATMTSYISLGHELHHCYFAKGVMPSSGNSGWLDEAIASWRDKDYQRHATPFYTSINLGNHSRYTRKTDSNSYKYGRSFMAYLDYSLVMLGKPGLKDFLKNYFAKRKYQLITNADFIHELNLYANYDFSADFVQYIFGGTSPLPLAHSHKHADQDGEQNPHHHDISDEQLLELL